MLRPRTSCREVVRQVQALFRLHDKGPVEAGDSAYVQARQRLPKDRLEKALVATAQAAERRVEPGNPCKGARSKSWTVPPRNCPTPTPTSSVTPNPAVKNPAAAFR